MASTYETFDDLYEKFIGIVGVDDFELPLTPQGKYELVDDALNRFNLFLEYFEEEEVRTLDKETEELIPPLSLSEGELVVAYMCLIIYERIFSIFVSTYDVMQDDIGLKNYKAQADARKQKIEMQNRRIRLIQMKLYDDFNYD